MRFTTALRAATTMMFAAGASVASAQLSSRSANGGLFNTLVDWNPVEEQALVGAGDVRMSPWAANRVQLGTVRRADPNKPWMGYWGHYENRESADIVGAEHSLRANPIALMNSTNRGHTPTVPEVATPNLGLGGGGTTPPVFFDQNFNTPVLPPAAFGPQGPLNSDGAANVIINPEPSVYVLAGIGLVLIALIRRFRMA